jgi:hypothetical protein
MSKNEFGIAIVLSLLINIFILYVGTAYHELPYWANLIIVNAGGLFCGIMMGIILVLRYRETSKRKE